MLETVRIQNFKSFAGEVTVDFHRTDYPMLSRNCTEDGLLKGLLFVGANASGKSNVLAAIRILLDMLFMERTIHSDLYKCIFNPDPQYSIEYKFRIDGHAVRYGFSVNTERQIISESLFEDEKLLLERYDNTARVFISNTDGVAYGEREIDAETLFLRTLYFNTRFTSNETLRKWMDYLRGSVYINAFERNTVSYGKDNLDIFYYLKENGAEEINRFFENYNFQQRVEYRGKNSRNGDLELATGTGEQKTFFRREGIQETIPFAYESAGNQNLLRMLPAFLRVSEQGGMLLIDEFSSGFHSELESLLIRYFMEKANRAQIIFVSHSVHLLSNSVLRPDQEYVVEFKGSEGSRITRVSDEKPRIAQSIEKMYLSGVFGGLPTYGKTDDED